MWKLHKHKERVGEDNAFIMTPFYVGRKVGLMVEIVQSRVDQNRFKKSVALQL
jgi:hypothetical protein